MPGVGPAADVPGRPPPLWELSPEQFRLTFVPEPGVNYAWVVKFAEAEYARAVELYRKLDDKAAAVANYLGAGAGLLTLGSVAGVAGGQLDKWVVLAAVPSVLLALAALAVATAARVARARPGPPKVANAAGYAEYHTDAGEAAFIGPWYECIEGMYPPIRRKARLVSGSLWLFAGAVVALLIPLAVGIAQRFTH